MICDSVVVKRSKICSGDMSHKIDLQERRTGSPAIGSMNPSVIFTTLLSPWCVIKTIDLSGGASRRFNNVNVEDRPTHEIFIYYDPSIFPLDSDKVFVLLPDGRRLRIVGVTNLNELDTTISLLCTERGLDEASKA